MKSAPNWNASMPEMLICSVDGDWQITTLGELCQSGGGDIQTGPFGSQLHASDYVTTGIPSVMPQNIGDNLIIEDGIARITPDDAARLSRYLLREGDIVYSRRGDVERRALVRQEQDGWLCGTGCLRVRPGNSADSSFLSYYLGHPDVREWIVRHAIGATMPNLNTSILSALPVTLPPLRTQAAIAAVLGVLDDKIAVNDRIVALADELVRSRYLSESLDCEDTVHLGDLGVLVRDTVGAELLTGDEHYIALEHMPQRKLWLCDWDSASGVASAKNSFLAGDVLFGKLRPYFHKVGVAFINGICSTDILVVRPREEIYQGWLLAALASDDVVAHASAVSDGTRMPRAKWDDLANYEVPWIGTNRAEAFEDFVTSLMNRVRAAVMESRVLAELRDALLPKLMSGEVRVREAERVVEDAT